jgi:hypothetical protein
MTNTWQVESLKIAKTWQVKICHFYENLKDCDGPTNSSVGLQQAIATMMMTMKRRRTQTTMVPVIHQTGTSGTEPILFEQAVNPMRGKGISTAARDQTRINILMEYDWLN